jgi:uncharacterized membrane protein (UPF0127 family)
MAELLVDGDPVCGVEIAETRATRNRGLLGRTTLAGALWIAPAKQVHTFGMKFAIDTAHVAKDGRVLHVSTLKPGRLGRWVWRTHAIVEAEAGRLTSWGVRPGVRMGLDRT